jgi:hypothetical protein
MAFPGGSNPRDGTSNDSLRQRLRPDAAEKHDIRNITSARASFSAWRNRASQSRPAALKLLAEKAKFLASNTAEGKKNSASPRFLNHPLRFLSSV